jgi:hypothetical protein
MSASLIMASCSMARVENLSTSRRRSVGLAGWGLASWGLGACSPACEASAAGLESSASVCVWVVEALLEGFGSAGVTGSLTR